ncbi:hypothetical protein [Nocardioides sp.]|uniref:hypothetical protein n=1 Tax=Nocardioides sp. TaxID=35761 RepID=UPI002ED8347E
MNPGQNYPVADHSPLFWVLFLVGVVLMVVVLTGAFLVAVARAGQATRATSATPLPEPASTLETSSGAVPAA